MEDPDQSINEYQQLEVVRDRFYDFLLNFWEETGPLPNQTPDSSNSNLIYPYREQVKVMAAGQTLLQETVLVDIRHVKSYANDLAEQIEVEWLRLEPFLRQAVQRLVRETDADFVKGDDQNEREFYVAWDGISSVERLRDLRSARVGGLLAWKGTITRTTEVRPELYLGTYKCGLCGEIVRNIQQQFVMTYPTICTAAACGNKKQWKLIKEESAFVDWQRAKVQENADEMPPGSLPRAMDVIIRNEMVETIRPGDKAVFIGSLIVIPEMSAFQAPGERTLLQTKGPSSGTVDKGVRGVSTTGARELHYKLAFLANNVQISNKKQGMVDARTEHDVQLEDVERDLGPVAMEKLSIMRSTPDIYPRLARSIAPKVYGHEDVKKAVLLMLVGGVSKTTPEGIKLRGDINVAIVGDPSTAKSQILKFVAGFLPRAIFTGGRSSSAAGLTATVVKEADSKEYAIEAGALMLADNGICCIDEFDKMDIKDQVAIHEAMEQQTISVAKAGIQATLNARAAILAAANPLGGRYDRSKSLRHNVNLPPAILSRFDLLHVMVDEINPAVDEAIAHHILAAHRGAAVQPPYTQLELQQYIRYARALKPKLSDSARARLIEAFKTLRANDVGPGRANSVYRITVRQLEALIRLSEALARVHLRTSVLVEDVQEAQRLIKASVHSAGDGSMLVDAPLSHEDPENFARQLLQDGGEQLPPIDEEMQEPGKGDQAMEGIEADENQRDENTDESRRVRRRPDGPSPFDGPGDPKEKPLTAEEEPQATPEPIKITRSRWTYLKDHALVCIQQAEEEHREATHQPEPAAQTFMGVSQHDIIKWHIKHELEKNALSGQDEVVSEIQLMQKVIHVMVAREGTLVEMQVPERRPGEGRQEFIVRREKERTLIINPNYYME